MKLFCAGMNYKDHAREMRVSALKTPVIFLKPETALMKTDTFYIPEFSEDIRHEVEFIVRICKSGKYINPEFAHKYYDAIGLGIDFTACDIQTQLKQNDLPWDKAKSFDNSSVAGHWLPKESFDDIQNIEFSLHKNGHTVQHSNTKHMSFKIDELIADISKFFTVKKGDIIYTGTPSGVGSVTPGDVLNGYLKQQLMFSIKIA